MPLPNTSEYFPGFGVTQPIDVTANITTRGAGDGDAADLLVTGGTRGTILYGIIFHPAIDLIADQILFVWHKPSGGETHLIAEVQVAAFDSATDTVPAPEYTWRPTYRPFVIAHSDEIRISTTVAAQAWTAQPVGGDLSENTA